MNFLNFLTSGAGIFNFNLQSLSLNTNLNKTLLPTSHLLKNISNQPQYPPNQSQQFLNQPQHSEISHSQISEPNQIMQNILTTSQAELLSHQQQLINQYMHLNIQLLSKKIQSLESQPQKKQELSVNQLKSNKKKIKKDNVNCGHNDRQHYAKGMCNNCYHKNGRTKKPWKCQHQKLYANGLCQNCYINKYNKMKRQKNTSNQKFSLEADQFNSEPKIQESS